MTLRVSQRITRRPATKHSPRSQQKQGNEHAYDNNGAHGILQDRRLRLSLRPLKTEGAIRKALHAQTGIGARSARLSGPTVVGAATYAADVRLLVRTEVGLVAAIFLSVLVSYVGLAVFVSGEHRFVGFLVLVAGVWSLVGAPVVHDRLHREHGEDPHALWGRGDRRKPPWWPAGRL